MMQPRFNYVFGDSSSRHIMIDFLSKRDFIWFIIATRYFLCTLTWRCRFFLSFFYWEQTQVWTCFYKLKNRSKETFMQKGLLRASFAENKYLMIIDEEEEEKQTKWRKFSRKGSGMNLQMISVHFNRIWSHCELVNLEFRHTSLSSDDCVLLDLKRERKFVFPRRAQQL